MTTKWLAFDIGCIECGEPSGVIGIYKTELEAKEAAERAEKEQRENWLGQHSMEIFEINIEEENDQNN